MAEPADPAVIIDANVNAEDTFALPSKETDHVPSLVAEMVRGVASFVAVEALPVMLPLEVIHPRVLAPSESWTIAREDVVSKLRSTVRES